MNTLHINAHRCPSRGQHRLRIGRTSVAGGAYFVTLVTADRNPILSAQPAATILFESMEWMEAHNRWTWRCAVIMPDHLHLVFELANLLPLGSVMKSFKGFTGNQINRSLGRHGEIWQPGYFDHRIRSFEKTEWVAFYCFRNPVHRGLTHDGRDWPWWRCKPDLWKSVEANYDELLALENERKMWKPPSASPSR